MKDTEEDDTILVSARGIRKSYGSGTGCRLVLQGVDLGLRRGEFVILIGASGCGKTTLLRIIAGLEQADDGEVVIAGTQVTRPMPSKVAVVFQQDALLPWYNIMENVGIGLAARRTSRKVREDVVRRALSAVGLSGYERSLPAQLSGGMRQRAALARGLVMEPKVLILDEPFAALDEQTRNLMGSDLRALHNRIGGVTVMVTHSLTEAVLLGDRVIALSAENGQIRDELKIPFGARRDAELVDTAEFVDLRHRLWSELQSDWKRAMLGR